MSDDRNQGEPRPDLELLGQYNRGLGERSGCWTAFVILWGIAFLLVGILITAVSGFCSFAVLRSSTDLRDFGGTLVGGLIVGIFLCYLGYFILRNSNR